MKTTLVWLWLAAGAVGACVCQPPDDSIVGTDGGAPRRMTSSGDAGAAKGGGASDGGDGGAGSAGGAADEGADGGADGGFPDGGAGSGGGVAANDVYVCGTCASARATNPGTPAEPLLTITQGITLAVNGNRPTVRVGMSASAMSAAYVEDVTLSEGVGIDGRWVVSESPDGDTWARTGPRTEISNPTDTGVKFPAGLTAATTFQGFSVHTNFAGSRTVAQINAITITDSSPTLRDFDVTPLALPAGSRVPNSSIGVYVRGASAAPTLEGNGAAASEVTAHQGALTSAGVMVEYGGLTANRVHFRGGQAGTNSPFSESSGIKLYSARGALITGCRASAGPAHYCIGFHSDYGGWDVRFEDSTATGCPADLGGWSAVPNFGAGVLFERCGSRSGADPVARNLVATGGSVGVGSGTNPGNTLAVGGAALAGCPVHFESVAPGRSFYVGGTGLVDAVSPPTTTIGLLCSFVSLTFGNSTDARCSVSNVDARGATGDVPANRSFGLRCHGSCTNQPASCLGSCNEIVGSTFVAGPTRGAFPLSAHVLVESSTASFFQNRIGQDDAGCSAGGETVGAEISGSGGTLVNNLILPGTCPTTIGIRHRLSQRPTAIPISFHSNTIVTSLGVPSGAALVNVGAQLEGQGTAGEWRNNIVVASSATTSFSFREASTGVGPLLLQNNLFFNTGGSSLYLDEGVTTLSSSAEINLLAGASANVSGNPSFTSPLSGNFTPLPGSPALDAGTPTNAPGVDLDGSPRPMGANPDIGCFEAP